MAKKDKVQCDSEQEFYTFIAEYTTNSTKPALITNRDDLGQELPKSKVEWYLSLSEDLGHTPIALYYAEEPEMMIGFCKETGLTLYIDREPFIMEYLKFYN